MKITQITTQKRHNDRVSVFVDGKYSFSLSLEQMEEKNLEIGKEVLPTDIAIYKKLSNFGKLFDKVLNLLARRPRSEWEFHQYLQRKEATEEETTEIITKLRGFGYVNDEGFAAAWVRSRRALKPTSLRRLRQELLQKRIDLEIIQKVLAEDETDEVEVIRQLIMRKRKQTRYQEKDKLIAYLLRQGFQYSAVKEVLEEEKEVN